MTANNRLRWIAVMIIASALYSVLIAKDPEVASACATGYIAGLLTIFVLVNFWKKK